MKMKIPNKKNTSNAITLLVFFVELAAKEAGLNRDGIDTCYIATKRYDDVQKFYEIIGYHDARRTFVFCSLELGIPVTKISRA